MSSPRDRNGNAARAVRGLAPVASWNRIFMAARVKEWLTGACQAARVVEVQYHGLVHLALRVVGREHELGSSLERLDAALQEALNRCTVRVMLSGPKGPLHVVARRPVRDVLHYRGMLQTLQEAYDADMVVLRDPVEQVATYESAVVFDPKHASVTVNGYPVVPGESVRPGDLIRVCGSGVRFESDGRGMVSP